VWFAHGCVGGRGGAKKKEIPAEKEDVKKEDKKLTKQEAGRSGAVAKSPEKSQQKSPSRVLKKEDKKDEVIEIKDTKPKKEVRQ